ncbi:hypothetical protein ACSHWB_33055 [Lentzea sp. HUAS TT2]|uniref:hypothetical protein n=1 Tax=Lentzea sp. HUAS TT2 TaxID=3447454 RepID=UPI003F712913
MSFQVNIDALDNHARTLQKLSDDLTGVNGKTEELPSAAFGDTAAHAASLVRAHTDAGQETLEAAIAALTAAATSIKATAAEYRRVEQQNTGTIKGAGGRR